jgi:hypothetical protein
MSGLDIAASTRGTDKDRLRVLPIIQTSAVNATPNNPYGNTIIVNFPEVQRFNQAEVAMSNLYIYFSWFNIQASLGNNTFTYNWPTNTGSPVYYTYTVTIPDGFYQINDLNAYFQQIQFQNGTYLESGTSGVGPTSTSPVYFLSFVSNPTYYRTTLTVTLLPDAADASTDGYVVPNDYAPAAGGALPPTDTWPQFTIPATNAPAGSNTPAQYSMSKSLGISPGSYPPANQSTGSPLYNINGQFAPFIESTSSVFVTCSLLTQTGLTLYPQVLATFGYTGVAFGSEMQIEPKWPLFVPIADVSTASMTIQFTDENFVPLNMQDPHITMTLLIRGR